MAKLLVELMVSCVDPDPCIYTVYAVSYQQQLGGVPAAYLYYRSPVS